MRKMNNSKKNYYFSGRLKRQLAQIPNYPLTIVEAPSGFGKTTAVREYLKENLSYDACEYWYTCLGESASFAWRGICELLSNVNVQISTNLIKLNMPTMDTLLYMTTILREFQCQQETYLVIDNYQLVNCDIPRELMSVFSMHGNPKLHMIFITQQLETRQQLTIHHNIHTINASYFFFERDGIVSLFRKEGIRLSDDELDKVYMSTEGWIAALRLQIINFEETGSFDNSADIEHLVENAIWKRLTDEKKEFLLSVSVMDSFTARQAAIMIDQDMLSEEIEELLKTNDFIRYFLDKKSYTVHSIFQDYLRNRFYYYQPKEFQIQTLRKAAQSYLAISQYYAAALLFFKIKDFDSILSLPLTTEELGNQKENYLSDFITALVKECPDEILYKYPMVMLIFGYYSYICGEQNTYRRLCRLVDSAIKLNKSFSPEELRSIKGHFAIVKAYEAFNDVKKMYEYYKTAWDILGKPTEKFIHEAPFTFGCPSVFYLCWRETGELDNELQVMEEFMPLYRKLTRGHGTGADSLMRAEVKLMRGEDDEAEILCHKVLYDSRSYNQTDICLGAELVLTRIAMMRGDIEGYFTGLNNIKSYAKDNTNLYVLRMIDLCLTITSLAKGSTESIAHWFCDMENIKKTLYAPIIPYAQIVYSRLLMVNKQYNVIFGLSGQILDTAETMNYILPQVYHYIYLAIAKRNGGNSLEAQEYLKKALSLALPDGILLPFAQQACMEDFLTELSLNITHISGIKKLDALKALCRRQQKGTNIIKKAISQVESPLTPREREIALLVRERLSAKEIAEKLYISEATVRTIIKSIYSKLNIHSKSDLISIDF